MFTSDYVPYADRIPNDLPDQDWQDDDETNAIKGILAGIGLSLPVWVVIGYVGWRWLA